ncbi:NADP-dependent oxidoreductase [Phenylobacterium sp. Root77]|jgi:NADPH-dependent curcumin reductase CurA|uniref:NADP-dependent oxidoreductase n=1 Tax=unclassified Phenylobacterium TaxID=2640670 RepID=UPI0006F8C8D0|nr:MULTISPECIES: NADP-dependent oxidoreductase [unclassified Phenylobacterium]KQW66949.1 NADP-dependent oxidoreductase [Phenylobacterium sp. Root1277]KQW89642.1 NADP-dependent oxidoreductase [Phenylobacterium sp. Root1290]KRC43489.1 NADP-dependent oxidoreductase [Phenylobacterium sp. Root77]
MTTTEEIHLVRRPRGVPEPDDFAHVEASVGEPSDGEVTVESLWMSVDPYMRPRLDSDQPLDAPLLGGGIGRVVESRHEKYREGDLVRHSAGFRKRFVSNGKGLSLVRADPQIPLSVYLHALGGTGLTAYGGLLDVGALKDGEQVFVSTAAGAVGSVAAQIAKLKGCYVVGSTGSDDKAKWLGEELGLDAVINYRREEIGPRLAEVTPQGIDVYFENVGGAHLDAALPRMNVRGRIPVCGMISTYNGEGEGVRNLFSLIYGRIRMEGFVASDFAHLNAKFVEEMSAWVKAGSIKYQETILDGFDRAPEGLIGLFRGENTGKMLIRVGE